jgi:hypothetical protein
MEDRSTEGAADRRQAAADRAAGLRHLRARLDAGEQLTPEDVELASRRVEDARHRTDTAQRRDRSQERT